MKEEKLGKSDYNDPFAISREKLKKLEDEYGRGITEVSGIRGVFHSIGQWFHYDYNYIKIVNWFWRIIIIGLISLALFGISKCIRSDIERHEQQEIEWTTGDSTFVKKQDGYYIYRREIEGHKYYLYKHKDDYGHLINDQYVPVNSCDSEVFPDEK